MKRIFKRGWTVGIVMMGAVLSGWVAETTCPGARDTLELPKFNLENSQLERNSRTTSSYALRFSSGSRPVS